MCDITTSARKPKMQPTVGMMMMVRMVKYRWLSLYICAHHSMIPSRRRVSATMTTFAAAFLAARAREGIMTSSMTKLPAIAVQSLRIIFMFSSGSWGCYIQILRPTAGPFVPNFTCPV